MAALAPVRDGVGPVVHLASAITALLQESIARNERTCGTCTGSSARAAATRPCNAPASPACSRRPTGGPRYRSEIRHDIRARERHLVLIVAVTWVDRVVQVLSGLRASNSPDGIPDALGSDNG